MNYIDQFRNVNYVDLLLILAKFMRKSIWSVFIETELLKNVQCAGKPFTLIDTSLNWNVNNTTNEFQCIKVGELTAFINNSLIGYNFYRMFYVNQINVISKCESQTNQNRWGKMHFKVFKVKLGWFVRSFFRLFIHSFMFVGQTSLNKPFR